MGVPSRRDKYSTISKKLYEDAASYLIKYQYSNQEKLFLGYLFSKKKGKKERKRTKEGHLLVSNGAVVSGIPLRVSLLLGHAGNKK